MQLSDKVAIVTGASSDIGTTIVRKLVVEGAKVILLGRNLEALEKTRNSINNLDSTVSISCDITNESQVLQTMEQIISK